VWQPSFSNYFEKSASLSKPKTWSAPIHTSIKNLTDEVLWAYKTLFLGKRIKIRPRILVAANGRSCLTITFNICTITCAVASYVHYMISFDMCQHSCARFVIWLQIPFIVLEFFTLLFVLHIQHVVLVSRLRRFKRSLLIFSRNCLTITHVVRRLITSTGCRPSSRKLLCFEKWTGCHSIFCHWLSSITVFAVPSCSPCWIQQSTGPKPWFLWTLCAHWFSNDNSSWIGSYGYFKLAFFGLQYSRCFHLQYNTCTWRYQLVMIMTEEHLLCARAHINLCKFPVNVVFFVVKSSALLLCLASD